MLFNSISFAFFLPVVFILYWLVTKNNLKLQNILLLTASYYFYACWDYRFLFLLIFSTLLDYYTGIKMYEAKVKRSKVFWFWLSICVNLGFLGIFKYYNFFIGSFADSLSLIGLKTNFWSLQVILPVGISFYTFHGLSYVIDIYKDRIKPERSFVDYSVFVSFFPLLVAGPIERATHLLPQIIKKRNFNYELAVDGLRQMLWGFFKKMVIADNCAVYVNDIFAHSSTYSGSTIAMGVLLFTFQIYCDFSGYSDIAIGAGKLFDIQLMRNFNFPYFSRDIAEFWRRWHISLSSWFKDYVYIPLGGSKGTSWMKVRNIFIIFLLSGLWHGANWTFVTWGLINAIYFLPLLLLNKNRSHLDIIAQGKLFPGITELRKLIVTFLLANFAWIFFRSESNYQAFEIIGKIFSISLFEPLNVKGSLPIFILILFMVAAEWLQRDKQHALQFEPCTNRYLKYSVYILIAFSIIFLQGRQLGFIYFQF
ncbi:MBOAT family protein [soil metagenome]